MLPGGDLERPGLVGPRNETVEKIAPPAGGLRFKQADRRRWQASDNKSGVPSEESRDHDEVGPLGDSLNADPQEEQHEEEDGPLGELMDDEEVGPLGESRSGDDGHHHDHEDGEQAEEGFNNAETVDELVQLPANTVSMMSGALEDAGTSPGDTATTLPAEPQTPLTSPSLTLEMTTLSKSRKRERDAKGDAMDDESSSRQKRSRMDNALGIVPSFPSQQNRGRMDGIFGIVRKNATEARVPQIVGAAVTSDIPQSKKRSRGPDDDSRDGKIQPTVKRQCLYLRSEETCGVEDQSLAGGHVDAATRDDSAFVRPPTSSNEVQEPATVAGTANTESLGRPTTEREPVANGEAEEREHATVEDEALPTQTGWNTQHGINSDSADVPVPRKGVFGVTGQRSYLYLPRSGGLLNRPWTEEEKEDLRAYIQDYRIGDWNALSQSMNRSEAELQYVYLEVAKARNILAGRPENDGIPRKYPKLTPPPRPKSPNRTEPAVLRSRSRIGRAKTHKLGDLTYDLKATSFPKVTRDGGMVDSKGNALLGIMGDLPRVDRRRQRPRQERPGNLLSSEVSKTVKIAGAVKLRLVVKQKKERDTR